MLQCFSFIKPKKKNVRGRFFSYSSHFSEIFLRERNFFLKIRAIRLSVVFGTRRRTALRGEGFAWVPDLGSFLKLREVGVSPYLSFTPILSVLLMFELNKAVRGRLIGSKP